MKATGYSTWNGSWKRGNGTISTQTKTMKDVPYTFSSRFEGAPGASPEELLAAAHAGCFNQALANNFGMISFEAESISTSVSIEFGDSVVGHPAIKSLHITVEASVPNISKEQFDYCVQQARNNCTISRVLKCDITSSATLRATANAGAPA
ncbi:OsmC family peroxiredoxin [Bradyrhizobium sp. B120]|uniref:OsmC family peroxiredoxin n=1 Tax=Bradyrhizobium sp. B120 TaxID=3410088 RepID=UPI003B97E30E